MSAWVSAAPVIGAGSLDGFAIGALMSGACALAITAPRHARRPSAARGGARAAERNGWLCEHVMMAEAVGFGLTAEAAVAAAAAEVVKARVAAGSARAELTGLAAGNRLAIGSRATAEAREGALPRIAISGGRSRREAHPDVVFPKADLPLVTLTSPRRREARRQPRHAAPSVGLGSRIAGFGSRMTGLFATRALASGARG